MTKELFTARRRFCFEAVRLMGDKPVRRVPVLGADGFSRRHHRHADVLLKTETNADRRDAEEISERRWVLE